MVSSISSSTVSDWASQLFSKLDTKNQGYISKDGLTTALKSSEGKGPQVSAGDTFSQLDGDGDGKITKSELTDAVSKVADLLNAQADASRVRQAARPDSPQPAGGAGGPPPAHGAGGAGGAEGASSTSGTSYVAAADTNGDGAVSEEEEAAYEKLQASGGADAANAASGTGSAGGAGKAGHAHKPDAAHELARALQQLQAYVDNSDSSAAASSAAAATTSVDVSA
jgi:hypothetical protein